MFITRMALPRRTFLRGIGATLALPLLDAMVPALSALAGHQRQTGAPSWLRLRPERRHPGSVGAGGDRRRFRVVADLAPLAAVRDKLLVLSGLTQRQADSFGDGNGDHARGCASWLNGVHPNGPKAPASQAGTTIDQLAASELGKLTRLPSLELALESQEPGLGSCDNGYACVYINTISWRTPTSPVPMEIHPRVAFDRLFGDGGSAAARLAQARRRPAAFSTPSSRRRRACRRRLGVERSHKVNEYLDSVREIERRIQRAEGQTGELVAGAARSSDRHSRRLRRAHEADVRSAGAGVSGRHHPRHLAADRRASRAAAPFRKSASPNRTTRSRITATIPALIAKKAKIDAYHVQLLLVFPREARRHARWRRLAARPLDHHVRRRARQSEPARAFESAGAAGRRWRRRS